MSATGRNLPGNERHDRDFYETPAWVTEAILPHLTSAGTVIDAGAGNGAIGHVLENAGSRVLYVDICPLRSGMCKADFVADDMPRVDLVISNPPYKLALPFVLKALELGREVAFLLRLNWLAGLGRRDFHHKHPADVFVLPRRPSFTGGGTDATEYAWFVWGDGRGNRWSIL